MSPISVYIEMPEYLKKYLISESTTKVEPLSFAPKHDYNILLTRLISNYRSKPADHHVNRVKIQLPFNAIKNVYFYNNLSAESRRVFREQIQRDMYYDFRVFLKDMILAGEQQKIALEKFFLLHGITEDDLKYESFYRNFTRFIEKRRCILHQGTFNQLNLKSVHKFAKKTA
ncbi:MAG: hypothetical protein P1P88_23730 [Bacteroidales bacterium]|nr:hypothetical protein [Bacteroidales bacterium]